MRHSVQKEQRIIDTIEPVLSQHRLVVDRKVIEDDYKREKGDNESDEDKRSHGLLYQFTRMTRQKGALKHDDAIDALAMAINWWTEYMAVNSDDSLERYKAELKDQAIKDFISTNKSTALHYGSNTKKKRSRGFNRPFGR